MKKMFFLIFFFSLSQLLLADVRGKTIYKCTFTLTNNQKVTGWFEVFGYENYCYNKSNSKFLNDKGMIEILNSFKSTNKIPIYRRLHLPKFAKSVNKQGFLKGQFLCCLKSDIITLEISKVKHITYINTLKNFDISWMDIAIVNEELLNLLENQKFISEYSTGESLVSYTFFNYNPTISKVKLKELAKKFYKNLEDYSLKSKGEKNLNNYISKLIIEYLNNNIVIVYAYSPC